MKTVLYIDTSDSQETKVVLKTELGNYSLSEKTGVTKSQNVLPLIEKVLQEKQLALDDLSAIEVYPGPGSFTGVRVGVSVANALGFALGIPVNGKHVATIVYTASKFD